MTAVTSAVNPARPARRDNTELTIE